MILYGKNNIVEMHINSLTVVAVYMHGKLLWSIKSDDNKEILSCYYNGYWIDKYPWTDNTSWTD